MPPSPLADLRYWLAHLRGLLRRGLSSLRARGWRVTWQRAVLQLRPPPAPPRTPLYRPAPGPFAAFAVPATTEGGVPRASIVIPVYNHAEATLACLRALAAHPPAAACEVIVVDDGSSDETSAWMPQVAGLRYHRRAANGGFIAACNDGASLARGEVLVFLNNDTIPQPGWLDALLATFDARPDAGLVVAQLLYPDGRLQESGGFVFDDGSCWSYGRFEAADDPRYAYLREADYGSGAALAIPRDLFTAQGGFDSRYAPAYYEDTDLAFAVRAAGRRVLVQPASRVLHDEGTTAGTDTGSGIKAYQVRNRGVFASKWSDALRAQPPPGVVPGPALLHARQRRVLVVDEAVPRPDRDSASLRQFNLLRMLRAAGAHVAFLPTGLAHAGEATQALQRLGVETWYAPFATSAPAWLRDHAARFDVIVLTRHHLATAFLPLLRESDAAAIVGVNSLLALQPEPHMVCTSAARAGVQNLLKSLATELAPAIRVNSVLLGLVDSGQWQRRWQAAHAETGIARDAWFASLAAKKGIPAGRLGQPEEPARAILFLGSPAASYVTGAQLEVSGGVSRFL